MLLRKYWIPLSVFLVAICAVGLYLPSIQPPKEPIVIYKPVEPLPKSEVKAPVGDTSQGGHWQGDVLHSESHTLSQQNDVNNVIDKPETQDSDIDFHETEVNTENIETLWEETADAKQKSQELVDDWNEFTTNLRDKYQMLFDLELLDRVSKTPEGRRKIVSQAKAMQNEALDYAVSIFSQIPYEDREEILRLSEEYLRSSNTGLSDKHINQSFEMIQSRLK